MHCGVARHIGALGLLLPLLALARHLRALHRLLHCDHVLRVLRLQLRLVDAGPHTLFFASAEVSFLGLSVFLLFNDAELRVFSGGHQVAIGDSTCLLLLLHDGLALGHKRDGLHGREVAQFAQSVPLHVGFEELAVKLVHKVEAAGIGWAETRAAEVQAKTVQVEVLSQNLLNHLINY